MSILVSYVGKRMKVILMPSTTENVGVSIHVLNLAKLLNSMNMLELVLCPKDGWLCRELQKNNISFKVLELSFRPKDYFTSVMKLDAYLAKFSKNTSIHLHGRFPLFLSLYSMMYRKNLNFFYTIHEFSSAHIDGFLRWKYILEKYLLSKVKKIAFVSFSLAEEVKKNLPTKLHSKCFTIYNFIEKFEYDYKSNDMQGTIKICSIGRLIEEKGFQYNLLAVQALVNLGYRIHYDIFGDGPYYSELFHMINRYKLEKSVTLKGNVDNKTLRLQLNEYDMLLIHSKREAFGLTALEAFNAKVPVIATNVSGLNEIVVDKETGLLVEYGDINYLVESIQLLILNTEIRRNIIDTAYNLFSSLSDENKLKSFYTQFYTSGKI